MSMPTCPAEFCVAIAALFTPQVSWTPSDVDNVSGLHEHVDLRST